MNNVTLSGLIPAVITPMTDTGQVCEPALRRYIRWLLSHDGLGGVAVNADTGEGPHLTPAERRRVLDIWVEEASGRVPVIAGLGGPSTDAARAGAREAAAAGADALLVFPIPAYLGQPLDPEVPYAYHRAIEEAAGLPMIAFQLQPALGGVLFDDACLQKLFTIESIVAIKEASFDALEFARVRDLLRRQPRPITLLTGNDNFIYESFVLGAQGALIGFGTLAVSENLAMIRAALDGHWPVAERYNEVIAPLARCIFRAPVRNYRARTKYALWLMGIVDGYTVSPPLLPLSVTARARVHRAMEAAAQLTSGGRDAPLPMAGAAE
jgi:4-hydroxy-tetrahydrodipicolinate synthase